MIVCATCGHTDYTGTLVCSQCGERLWMASAGPNITITTDTRPPPSGAPASGRRQITVRIRGENVPVVLSGKDEYRIGRADDGTGAPSDLDLSKYRGLELGVSRHHAVLRRSHEGVTIVDQHSTNGSALNGKRLVPDQPYTLTSGDELRLGKLVMRVYFEA